MSNASLNTFLFDILFIFSVCVYLFFQGRFRINLSGTGFKVAEETSWISQGNYAVADVQKSQVLAKCSCLYSGKT